MQCDGLIREQAGLVTRAQLRQAGVRRPYERTELRAGRWRALNDSVLCTHNGPLSRLQMMWAAILSCRGTVALCGLTALERFGVVGLTDVAVHVLVTKGARPIPVPGVQVVVHQSRRFSQSDVLPRLPPVTSIERATIDAAVWSPDVDAATRVVVAPVQQRFTTAARLRQTLAAAGWVRFRTVLLLFLADLEGGAEALSEVAFLTWCRKHGFPRPRCNVRQDATGRRRYLDAEFRRSDGSALWAEIDGGVHLNLMTRWADTAKDNDDVIARRTTLRFPSIAIYSDDPRAIAQLQRALATCPTHGAR